MRVLLFRVGVLGAVVVLGWITIANAQRGGENLVTDQSTVVVEGPARPSVTPPTGDANPLRRVAPTSSQSYPSSDDPVASRPATDPFGLVAQRNGNVTTVLASAPLDESSIPDASALELASSQRRAAEPSRYPQMAVPSSVGQSSGGPTLVSDDQYATSAATDSHEPAPLKIDPFAAPASPMRSADAENDHLDISTQNDPTTEAGVEGEGVGRPGATQFEGVQSPQLTIQKLAPKEIQVDKPASFRITVRNIGQIPACEVEVRDLVPQGTRLLNTTPQANRGPQGEVVWTLGTIRPGEESTVEMQLMPMAEGEIGSVATVYFAADASARCTATRPRLTVATTGPEKVLIGDQAMLTITVSNPGTGVATGVVLQERIPPGLQHPAGGELEYEVGDLKPGETRKLDLPLVASQPGPATNLLSARADGNLHAEHKLDLEVLAPQLDVVMEGPKRRYLERQATYQLSVTNPGTASAKQVELMASLPPGLKFVRTNNAGHYEESTRTVRWRLEELPANETGSVELVTMPVTAGEHAIRLRGTAEKGLAVEKEQPVTIEGIAAVSFQVGDAVDPVEVGGHVTYEVHVVNEGSKAAANVQLAVVLPPEMKPVAAEGPTHHALDGNRLLFDGLAQLAPKAETAYRVRVQALQPGDLRASFQLRTDDMQTPVTKEESTRVYADQ